MTLLMDTGVTICLGRNRGGLTVFALMSFRVLIEF